jgi:single-stranded DNA-binding protein
MECVNLGVISGYLARDPAMRHREDGMAQCPCTSRVEEVGPNGTLYKTCVVAEAYGKTADAVADLHQGDVVMVQGKVFWRQHVTQGGVEKRGLAVLAQKASLLAPAAVPASSN